MLKTRKTQNRALTTRSAGRRLDRMYDLIAGSGPVPDWFEDQDADRVVAAMLVDATAIEIALGLDDDATRELARAMAGLLGELPTYVAMARSGKRVVEVSVTHGRHTLSMPTLNAALAREQKPVSATK